jgi:hypothetical protein
MEYGLRVSLLLLISMVSLTTLVDGQANKAEQDVRSGRTSVARCLLETECRCDERDRRRRLHDHFSGWQYSNNL